MRQLKAFIRNETIEPKINIIVQCETSHEVLVQEQRNQDLYKSRVRHPSEGDPQEKVQGPMINPQIRNNPLLALSLNYSLVNIHNSITLAFQLSTLIANK